MDNRHLGVEHKKDPLIIAYPVFGNQSHRYSKLVNAIPIFSYLSPRFQKSPCKLWRWH